MVTARAVALLALGLAGCAHAVVVRVPASQGWEGASSPFTAELVVSEAALGGTTLELEKSKCTGGTTPGNIRVCTNSRACAEQADRPAVHGVIVLYDCVLPPPPSGEGVGVPSGGGL